jgi:hypothetical protein
MAAAVVRDLEDVAVRAVLVADGEPSAVATGMAALEQCPSDLFRAAHAVGGADLEDAHWTMIPGGVGVTHGTTP